MHAEAQPQRAATLAEFGRQVNEHPLPVIKNRFGHRKVRYRGLAKNTAQLFSLFALANLVQTKGRVLAQGVIAP
jgi:IS5 family transposase